MNIAVLLSIKITPSEHKLILKVKSKPAADVFIKQSILDKFTQNLKFDQDAKFDQNLKKPFKHALIPILEAWHKLYKLAHREFSRQGKNEKFSLLIVKIE